MAPPQVAIELEGVSKRFPGVRALDRVDLAARRGEVHALLGENGAGKSTAIKVMTGVQAADEGRLLRDGEPIRLRDPHDAHARGIDAVPQDVLVVPELSIGRNLLLGLEGMASRREVLSGAERALVEAAMDRIGATFDPEAPASSLSVPELRLAQLARTLIGEPAEVLILDEPTAVLSEQDAEHLLQCVRSFRDEGAAIVYVSHRLNEVMELADRITVLRDGRVVGTSVRGELDKDDLIAVMDKDERPVDGISVPRHLAPPEDEAGAAEAAAPLAAPEEGPPLLEVRGLSSGGRFRDVSFSVRPGEIVGIAGVQGSGHGHLLRSLAGAFPATGEIEVAGEPVSHHSVREPIAAGMLLVPADRRNAAIVGSLSVRGNLAISRRIRSSCRRYGLRWHRRERAMVDEYAERFSIRADAAEVAAGTLSGGNQQKVALARALEGDPRVLLAEEPTQGIDIHAKREIRALLVRAARQHDRCVVVASSEFEELLDFADTIHVMCLGRLVATLSGETTYRKILTAALP